MSLTVIDVFGDIDSYLMFSTIEHSDSANLGQGQSLTG